MKKLHNWNLSYTEAIKLQRRLAGLVKFTPIRNKARLISGLDCGFSEDGEKIIAAAVVLRAGDLEIVEVKTSVRKVTFPYIPGLLSFREAPVCIAAVKKLNSRPDIFIIDGQGIAHPRRLGLAAHLGLFFDKPTIGCAKSRLTGTFKDPPPEKGLYSQLSDRGEIVGAVVRTRTNVKPVFVSVGNRCTLKDAISITLDCAIKYRLPEPTRLADKIVKRET